MLMAFALILSKGFMKLQIKSDGTTVGTRVTDIDTGEPLGYIQKITWQVSVEDPVATCTVVIAKMPIELVTVSANVKDDNAILKDQ